MRTIMARTHHESSSFSRRFFNWKLGNGGGGEEQDEEEVIALSSVSSSSFRWDDEAAAPKVAAWTAHPAERKKVSATAALSRFRSVLTAAIAGWHRAAGLGGRVTGTLFGHRRGHVHFAFQVDPRACTAVLIELAAPTCALVREMASGMVRIVLECERRPGGGGGGGRRLLEEPLWRAYCNGRKWGCAVRRECGPADWRVLRTVEAVSMGAGVLPKDGSGGGGSIDGDMMYMRARFERVVGSKDSEAFYMMNPDKNGGPELTIYLLRV